MTTWMTIAEGLNGTTEFAGAANNPTIIGWAKRLVRFLGVSYLQDSVPWCGLFVAHCMNTAGIEPPAIAVRAKSWAEWGANLRADRLAPGAVLVFMREGGGHVGFYVGEDSTTYSVLGGNQSDKVCITRITKSRCIARRWPRGIPVDGAPVWLASKGTISKNEA